MNSPTTLITGYAAKEVDMALLYIKAGKENSIPQDSFREETLDQLESFDLIKKLPNGNYSITEEGLYARQLGAFKYMEMKKAEKFFGNYSPGTYNNKKKLISTSYLIALLLLLGLFMVLKNDFFS